MPTPAIAYLTRTLHAQAGIVISASHNPYYDNGIKFFSAGGTKLPDEIEFALWPWAFDHHRLYPRHGHLRPHHRQRPRNF